MSLKINFVVIIVLLIFHILNTQANEQIDAEKFSKEFSTQFIQYFDTNSESEDLKHFKKILLEDKNEISLKDFPSKVKGNNCLRCYSVATSIFEFYHSRTFENEELSLSFLEKLCIYSNLDKPYVCQQEVKNYFPYFKFILQKGNITVEDTCDRILQAQYCFKKNPQYEGLHIDPPILTGSKKYHSTPSNNLKIIQFSDFHYDPDYAVGSSTKCGTYICCRGPQESNQSIAAGKWGDQPCDTPDYTIRSLLENAAKNFPDVDFIYLTGDYVDHFNWFLSRQKCLNSIEFVTNLIKEYFPNVPVIPIFGNHDTFPANLFSPNSIKDYELSSEWLYKNVSNIWKNWFEKLNDKNTLNMFEKTGYYTVKLRPNFRIIALNSNVCFAGNLWLLYDNFYFRDQLEWLYKVLEEASNNGEKVHILSHVPSNDVYCYRTWTKEFKKIVERFTNVISAQFNGHSHLDEFVIFYASEDPSVALNVAWNGGGGTTFPNVYPNYKVYYVDDQTYDVTNSETWTFDLNKANESPDDQIQWYHEYSFKSYFNVPDMSPDSIDKMVKRMKQDEELLEKYRRIRVKQSEAPLRSPCDTNCANSLISSINRSEFDDKL